MVDPASFTATTIAALACRKFLESGAGELGKKFTTAAIARVEGGTAYIGEIHIQGKPD